MSEDTFDLEGLETTFFTPMSVALESFEKIIMESSGGADYKTGYILAAARDMRNNLDGFLEDHDVTRLIKTQQIAVTTFDQMRAWGMHK